MPETPSFDVALGLHVGALQRAVDKIYQDLYPKYFRDSAQVETRKVDWDIRSAPQLDFSPDPALAKLLADGPEEETVAGTSGETLVFEGEALDSLAGALNEVTIKLRCPKIDVTIHGTTEAKTTASAVAFVNITTEAGKIMFKATGAQATSPSKDDQFFLNKVIIPAMKKMANDLFSAIQLPPFAAAGVKFDWPEARLISNTLVIIGKTLDRHMPLGLDAPLPLGQEAFLVLSSELLFRVFNAQTRGQKKEFRTNGQQEICTKVIVEICLTTAHWDAEMELGNMRVNGLVGVRTDVNAAITGRVRGWVTTFAGDLGTGFRIDTNPDPGSTLELSVDGNRNVVRGTMTTVRPTVVSFTPTGSAIDKFIGYILTPLTTFATMISPGIVTFLKGIGFDIWSIPDINIAVDKVKLGIRMSDLAVRQGDPKHVHVTGRVKLS